MTDYAQLFNPRITPQDEPIPSSTQVPNNAGGYAWAIDDWGRLQRFLILGSDAPTYYQQAPALTRESAEAVLRCAAADAARTVETIASVSESGRAPKNDPAIFALALLAALGADDLRAHAFGALGRVCRIGTHLFHFMRAYEALRPAGLKDGRSRRGRYSRSVRRALAAWYQRDADDVAWQVVKYGQRDGWSHRDVINLAHPKPLSPSLAATYSWIRRPGTPIHADAPRIVKALEALREAKSAEVVAWLVREYKLPREAVERADTMWLREPTVWEALLPHMPLEAMVRQLGVMTARGVVAPLSEGASHVARCLGDAERIRRSRLHPLACLRALLQYKHGSSAGAEKRGERLTWVPVAQVIDALDVAFYLAFENAPTTGKRHLLALDVSGSMRNGSVGGVAGLTPAIASAAMAMVTAAREPAYHVVAFSHGAPSEWVPAGIAAGNRGPHTGGGGGWSGHDYSACLTPLAISPRQRLDDVLRAAAAVPMGGTDCALPMLYAMAQRLSVDVFVIYTDSETWAGKVHPAQALRLYREQSGIAAKLVVVAMTSAGFTIADPADAGMLDVVGFDAGAPAVMAGFMAQ